MITFGSSTIVEIQLGKKSKKKGNTFVACPETSNAFSLLLKIINGAVQQLSLPSSNRHRNPYEWQGGGPESGTAGLKVQYPNHSAMDEDGIRVT